MHNIGIQYPRIVSVVLSKPDAPHPVIVPLEVCTILPNQIYKKRLPSELTAQAVTFGTTKPLDRWKAITGQERNGRKDIYAQTPVSDVIYFTFVVSKPCTGRSLDIRALNT